MTRIVLNGMPLVVDGDELTYDQLVSLAGAHGYPSATYAKGAEKKPSGMLIPGDAVPIVNDMIFNVIGTGGA
jgi:hypothetical protein